LNLIKALNNSRFKLMIVGEAAPNHKTYYERCKKIAADNVVFAGQISPAELAKIYGTAKVHVLPSWFETCGLSSLEAAAMGCNVVITDKGYAKDYFEQDAYYCDPADPASIRDAVERASASEPPKKLRDRVLSQYTWRNAASATRDAYNKLIPVDK
jgi:glycosyltransferase involved in cell wall biosynthesis